MALALMLLLFGQSVPINTASFKRYANETEIFRLSGNGNLNVLTGSVISTRANNASDGQGQIYLNGASGNRIDFGIAGLGGPTLTARSTGAKIVLFPNLSASATDYALGVESSGMWQSIPTSTSTHNFRWYGGTTQIAQLSGNGNLTVTGTVSTPSITLNGTDLQSSLSSKQASLAGLTATSADQLLTGTNLKCIKAGTNISLSSDATSLTINGPSLTSYAPLASPSFTGTVSVSGISASGQTVSTRANNVADGQGQIYLNGSVGNRIWYSRSIVEHKIAKDQDRFIS